MAALLREWLVDDVKVQSPCSEFATDLASGYIFGEVLAKNNLQPDFDQFADSRAPAAVFNNYRRLQPTLQKLGIRLSKHKVAVLSRGESDAAAQLLYQIKNALAVATESIGQSSNLNKSKLVATFGMDSQLSTGLLDAQQYRTGREAILASNQMRFADSLAAVNARRTADLERMHLQKFADEGKYQALLAAQGLAESQADEAAGHALRRLDYLNTLHSTVAQHQDANKTQAAAHQAIVDRQHQLDKQDLRIEMSVAALRKQVKKAAKTAADLEVTAGIDTFESNLQRLTDGEASGADDAPHPVLGETALEHIQRLRQLAPSKEALQSSGQSYMQTIKAKVHDETLNRRDRKARRRKALSEQQNKLEKTGAEDEEEQVLSVLMSKGATEAALSDEMGRLRVQEEIIRNHRLEREAEYAERREREWERAVEKEAHRHRELRAQYEAEHAQQMAAYKSLQEERAEARHQKHLVFADETAWLMVGFAERAIKYRQDTDGAKVPKAQHRQWVSMFTAGAPELAAQPAAALAPTQPNVTQVDEQAVTDYLNWTGDWQAAPGEQASGYNEALAEVIAEGVMAEVATKKTEREVPDVPLRLALVGAPFSGKTTMARKLAEEYGCKVLTVGDLVKAAIAEADAYGKQSKADVPAKVRLGRAAEASQQAGKVAEDEVQNELVVLAIKEVQQAIAAQPVVPPSTAKPAAKPAAKGKKDEAKPLQGYVLDGYPASAQQAELLEGSLTGLDLASERAIVAQASRLAPPPSTSLPDLNRSLPSGLDAVMVLETHDDGLAIKRALGRRVDPQSGRVYHLEFDPPPPKEPGLADRLKAVPLESNEGGQLTERLAGYAQQAPILDAWLARFPTLRKPLPAQQNLPEVAGAVEGVAKQILASKAAVNVLKAALSAAERAEAAAQGSSEHASRALGAAQATARALLTSKRAECEAAELLERTKNPKDADPVAGDLLRAQAAEKCAGQLKLARAAVAEVKAAADAAGSAAAEARRAATDAETSPDLAACAAAQALATAAADKAAQSVAAAAAAADRARACQTAAEGMVEEVERRLLTCAMPGADVVKAYGTPIQAKVETAAEVAGILERKALPLSLGQEMAQQWRAGEASYLQGLTLAFAQLRTERAVYPGHYAAVRSVYLVYLQRPAQDKQDKLLSFQKAFNGVDIDLRSSPEAKAELMLRCDELQDALWEMCDQRMNDNESQLRTLREDTFLREHLGMVAVASGQAVQLEVDRFSLATSLLLAAAKAHWGQPAELEASSPPDVLGNDPPAALKAKFEKATAMAFPDWVAPLEKSLPGLASAVKYALAAAATLQDQYNPQAAASKGKPGKAPVAAKKADVKSISKDGSDEERVQAEGAEGVQREVTLLQSRLRSLAAYAQDLASDIDDVEQRSWARLGDWMKQRFHAECSAVSALHGLASQAAFQGQPLPYQLDLQGEELVIDESQAAIEPLPNRDRAPLPEPPITPGALSWNQMSTVAVTLKTAASGSQLLVTDAAELMLKLGSSANPALPFPWQGCSLSSMTAALQSLDPLLTAYLDWRLLLRNLLANALPDLATASKDSLLQLKLAMQQADSNADGSITQDELMTLDVSVLLTSLLPAANNVDAAASPDEQTPDSVEDAAQEAESAVGPDAEDNIEQQEASESGADGNGDAGGSAAPKIEGALTDEQELAEAGPDLSKAAEHVKALMCQALWGDDSSAAVDIDEIMLFLSCAADGKTGLQKAFDVLTAGNESSQADEAQLIKLFASNASSTDVIKDALEDSKTAAMSFDEVMQLDGKAEGHQAVLAACRRHCTMLADLAAL